MNAFLNLRQYVNQHKMYTSFIAMVLAAICSVLAEHNLLVNHLAQGTLFDARNMGGIITIPFSQVVITGIISLVFFWHVVGLIQKVKLNDLFIELIVPLLLLFLLFNWKSCLVFECFG